MRAHDLVEQVPVLHRDTPALEAARLLAALRVEGLLVADRGGDPVALIAGWEVLRLVVPRYVRDDEALARVFDENGAAEICAGLLGHSVGDLLDDDSTRPARLPVVAADDTLVEIAAVMLRERVTVAVVRAGDGSSPGVVTLARLLAAVLKTAGAGDAGVESTLVRDLADLHEQGQQPPSAPPGGPRPATEG